MKLPTYREAMDFMATPSGAKRLEKYLPEFIVYVVKREKIDADGGDGNINIAIIKTRLKKIDITNRELFE